MVVKVCRAEHSLVEGSRVRNGGSQTHRMMMRSSDGPLTAEFLRALGADTSY